MEITTTTSVLLFLLKHGNEESHYLRIKEVFGNYLFSSMHFLPCAVNKKCVKSPTWQSTLDDQSNFLGSTYIILSTTTTIEISHAHYLRLIQSLLFHGGRQFDLKNFLLISITELYMNNQVMSHQFASMEDSENRSTDQEVQEFIALVDKIQEEKKYWKGVSETKVNMKARNSETWLPSFQWEDFSNNVQCSVQPHHVEELKLRNEAASSISCMKKRKCRSESPKSDTKEINGDLPKQKSNNSQKACAAFDLNV